GSTNCSIGRRYRADRGALGNVRKDVRAVSDGLDTDCGGCLSGSEPVQTGCESGDGYSSHVGCHGCCRCCCRCACCHHCCGCGCWPYGVHRGTTYPRYGEGAFWIVNDDNRVWC